MRIGELAGLTGVSRRSLRYYEEKGLLQSRRTPSGQREYDDDQIRRVSLIQTFFSAGMSSGTIVEMLPCMTTTPTVQASEAAMLTMESERRRLSDAMARLTAARELLDELIVTNHEYRDGLNQRASSVP